ncbi:MAG: glycosyltransferase family 2 protein [Dehalococcoidia bacterium]|nr:glycosyltransferase family 2 protein [Dehalococcoidia bacterium]
MSADVSVVIVTYNSAGRIRRCLDSLDAARAAGELEVIVADNASADRTRAIVAEEYVWARLLARPDNDGLSAAINDGVRASTGAYVAVLNPDVHFAGRPLATLASYLRAHPDVGVVAPKLLDDDGALQLSCRAFPGYATALFNRYSLLTRLSPGNARSRQYLMTDFDHASERDVDWLSGAALMLPRRVFDEVGGWDEGYFMFNEDVDLCRRVHDAGYRVVYQPAAVVHHTIGVSKSASRRMIIERHRSMWRYYRRHLRGGALRDGATAAGIAARCGVMLARAALLGLRWRGRGGRR